MIGVIEYGAGNITSVGNALEACNARWTIISKPEHFKDCSKIILPGVGSFAQGMHGLKENNLIHSILNSIDAGKPFLGICLGMQLLFEQSFEHGKHQGLGIIPGEVLSFADFVNDIHIPHVGWNDCTSTKESTYKLNHAFYFTHSYFCRPTNTSDILAQTEYQITFTSAVQKNNVTGFQFHPEKSHMAGLNLLKEFVGTNIC